MVRRLSGGTIDMTLYPMGTLPGVQNNSALWNAMATGQIDMIHSHSMYWSQIPGAVIFTALPFGMTTEEITSWLYGGGGLEVWRNLYQPFNAYTIPLGNTGPQMAGWFPHPIVDPSSFNGLKMRITSLAAPVLQKLGVQTTGIGGAQIVPGLQSGLINAVEWVGPVHDELLGIVNSSMFYYSTSWHEPTSQQELVVNLDVWKSLPSNVQGWIEVAAEAVNSIATAEAIKAAQFGFEDLRRRFNVTPQPFPSSVIASLREKSLEVITEQRKASTTFSAIADLYDVFRQRSAVPIISCVSSVLLDGSDASSSASFSPQITTGYTTGNQGRVRATADADLLLVPSCDSWCQLPVEFTVTAVNDLCQNLLTREITLEGLSLSTQSAPPFVLKVNISNCPSSGKNRPAVIAAAVMGAAVGVLLIALIVVIVIFVVLKPKTDQGAYDGADYNPMKKTGP